MRLGCWSLHVDETQSQQTLAQGWFNVGSASQTDVFEPILKVDSAEHQETFRQNPRNQIFIQADAVSRFNMFSMFKRDPHHLKWDMTYETKHKWGIHSQHLAFDILSKMTKQF